MTDQPTGTTTGVAGLAAGLLAFLLTGVDALTVGAGAIGLLALGGGYLYESRAAATAGAAMLFVGVLLAGVAGVGTGLLVAGAAATVLAWTFTHSAVDLHESLGSAPSGRLELAHVAGTTGLVGGAGVLAYATIAVDIGTVPPLALVALLAGAIALTAALRG